MRIKKAKHYGFCYGVKRAIDMAQACVNLEGNKCTLGPIIHNPQMVEHLADQGIHVAEQLADIYDGTVIFRSHGVGPEIYNKATTSGLHVVDATCPHVKKAQQAARQLLIEGYSVIIVGEKHHPEVKSITEWTDNQAIIIESTVDAEKLNSFDRLGVVSQTTISEELFNKIVAILKNKSEDIKVNRTICNATDERQKAAVELASEVDVMIVVGGKNSANTTRLAELCQQAGCQVYHVETAAELDLKWFSGVNLVGLTAGASTPEWIIEEVYTKMQQFSAIDMQQNKLASGSIFKTKVVSVREDEIFVDIGGKGEGVIPLSELAYPIPQKASDIVKEGDVIDVYVLEADEEDHGIKLSKVHADRLVAWDNLQQALEAKQTIPVKVTTVVKGGLAVAISGIRGFIPASQVDTRFTEDLEPFVGQMLSVIPIEIDKNKQRAVFSRRALIEQERSRKEHEKYSSLQENQTVKGTVTRITDFGAFVDIGGVEGLIHISDLAWHRVASPQEVVAVGDEVTAIVLKADEQTQRISLSIKAVMRDPWFDAVEGLREEQILNGTVKKIMKFGAFVEIKKDVEGLVHVSEISDKRIANAQDALCNGQSVRVKILNIDKHSKRISLSMIQVERDAEREEYQKYLNTQSNMNPTIGDKLGHIFNRMR